MTHVVDETPEQVLARLEAYVERERANREHALAALMQFAISIGAGFVAGAATISVFVHAARPVGWAAAGALGLLGVVGVARRNSYAAWWLGGVVIGVGLVLVS